MSLKSRASLVASFLVWPGNETLGLNCLHRLEIGFFFFSRSALGHPLARLVRPTELGRFTWSVDHHCRW